MDWYFAIFVCWPIGSSKELPIFKLIIIRNAVAGLCSIKRNKRQRCADRSKNEDN